MRSLVVAGRKRAPFRVGIVAVAGAMVLAAAANPAAAQDDGSDTGTRFHPGTAAPALVSGMSDEVAVEDPATAALRHLAGHPDTYAIDRPGTDLTPLETVTDGAQRTVRFAQSYRGVPVFGAHYLVHMTDIDGGQRVTGASGRFFTELDLDTTAAATEDTVLARAEQHVASQLAGGRYTGSVTGTITGADPVELTSESHGLVVLPGGSGRLAYHVTVRVLDPDAAGPVQREVYLDADAAFPVHDYSGLPQAAVTGTGVTAHGQTVDIELDSVEAGFELRDRTRGGGDITTWDARGYDLSQVLGFWPPDLTPYLSPDSHVDGELTSAGAVDAHVNAGHVYDYYAGLGRNGLDGTDGPIDSVTGVTFFGTPFVNAFWDGQKMIYGGGDDEFHVLSADLDVVGHEMTHGVIEHSADLVYAHQSGALNEAIADYFGNAVDVEVSGTRMDDPDAGLLGEDLCRTLAPRDCALRDLDSGLTTADFVPVTYDHDNGGVHVNSTIFAGTLWQIRKELGGELADRLVYKALTEYLTPLDGFADGRAAIEAAAEAIGLSRHQQWTIAKLFWRHGIYDGWERTLRLDGTELLGPITTTATYPNATGGVWTTSNSDPAGFAPYQVFAGRTDGSGGPVQLSDGSDPDRFHVYPATDGESVVWAAWGSRDIQIMRAPADGSGTPEEVFRTGVQLSNLTYDGQYVAWQATDSRFGSKVFYLDLAVGVLTPVDNTFFQNNFAPYLHDGKLLYLNRDQRQPHRQLQPVVKDLATGQDTVLPLPDYDPEQGIGWLAPRMSDDYVVTFADTRGDEAASLLRYPVDGGAPTVLIDETADDDERVLPGQIDITGSAITFSNWPGPTVPKVYQLAVTGGKIRPMSCSSGMQPVFDADADRRVVYFDGAAGHTVLAVRDHPIGNCGR